MSFYMQTEAIFACKGKELDDSKSFDLIKLVNWIEKNLPSMVSLEKIRKIRSEKTLIPYEKP